jgi:hypothetical protein
MLSPVGARILHSFSSLGKSADWLELVHLTQETSKTMWDGDDRTISKENFATAF